MRKAILVLLAICSLLQSKAQTANFTADVTAACVPFAVSFKDQSIGNNIVKWAWDFGDGRISAFQNPALTYFSPGTFTIKLTVTDIKGNSNTLTRTGFITAYGRPVIDFKGIDSTGCFPLNTQFTDLSTPGFGTKNVDWFWDFADGTTANQQNPLHTYTQSGNFAVSLKVTNDKGCFSVYSKPNYIKVKDILTADFTNTLPTVCHAPFAIGFTATAVGSPVLNYTWDFGDGTKAIGLLASHTYANPGSYTPVLTVTSSSTGCVVTVKKQLPLSLQNTVSDFANAATLCSNTTLLFQNTSLPAPVSSLWKFSDGTTLNALNPTKSFSSPGTYNVKLYNTFDNCTDSVSKTIQVQQRAHTDFSTTDTVACQPPFTTHFSNTSTGATSYFWDFGDGATSTAATPVHTYTAFGKYTVKLIATNASGCSDTLIKDRFVNIEVPQIKLVSLPIRGCLPFTIKPTANITSNYDIVAYKWDFGDGTTSTAAAPAHTYTVQGSYTVSVTVTTKTGCQSTLTLPDAVRVGNRPTVGFSAVPNPVCGPEPVNFTDLTTGDPIVAWQWHFGDGSVGTVKTPAHKYSDTGTLDVKLIVTTAFGCTDSLFKPKYITIFPPVAKFTPVADCSNKKFFTFIEASVVDPALKPLAWQWDFGDGSRSTGKNATHTYAATGKYSVLLAVTNGVCTDSARVPIQVIDETVQLSAAPTEICKADSVRFTATAGNPDNIASYDWDFGNGVTASGSPSQMVKYDKAGIFTVSVIVTDLHNCRDLVNRKITVAGATADFTINRPAACKSLITRIADRSTASAGSKLVKWEWDFGDNSTVTKTNNSLVLHEYANPGTYNVKLIVTNDAGCVDSLILPNTIGTTDPKADFISTDTLSCPQSMVNFTNLSTGIGLTSFWSFGNGSTATDAGNTQVRYSDTGRYTVKLLVTDQYNCKDSVTRSAYIRVDRPIASFTVSDTASYCIPFEVHFKNTSHYYVSTEWNLNGSVNVLDTPLQYYTRPGRYLEKLKVTSPGGCVDFAERTVVVYDVVQPTISYTPLRGCSPLDVRINSTEAVKQSYIWDYGDGAIEKTDSNTVNHIYRIFGNYVPKVIVKNIYGCIIAVTGPDTIKVVGATTKFGVDKKILCDSGYVKLLDSTKSNDPVVAYHWKFGDGQELNTPIPQSPEHFYNKTGTYLTFLDVVTRMGCVDTFRLDVPIRVALSPVVHIGGDSVICVNEYASHLGIIDRMDSSGITWRWQLPGGGTYAAQNPARLQYRAAGRFQVSTVVTSGYGCPYTAYKNIKVNPLPVVNMPGTITTQLGYPSKIDATYSPNVISYAWLPATGLSCTNCPQPLASPKFNTTYTVSVVDQNGCKNTGQVQVIVFCKNSNVFVPNTFSPNGDGTNDIFYVRGRGLDRVKLLRIFNRWGEVVFERANFALNDASAGWDGTYKGAKVQPDVYVYQIDVFCDNSESIRFAGNVSLLQ